MLKKRNQKIHECQTAGRKILCGKFAQTMKSNYAVGDQDNNLLLYNNLSSKPISMMNSQTSNVSSLTALTFANHDSQIIAGSNRGSLNSWDIENARRHTIEVCSLYTDKKNSNLVVSGSMDTNAKIWDLRTKNAISTLKNHHKKVTALNMTPDSRIVVSGSEDGVVQSWQIRMQRVIFQYDIGSAILSLDSNLSNTLVVGTQDRVARLFQINAPFSMIGQTKNETMPISNSVFYKENYLFTAGTDNLKVWNIQSDIVMTDNIETSSKGILHMIVDDKVQQIAYCGGSLSYHECLLTQVNFSTEIQSPALKYEIKDLEESPFSLKKNLSTIKRGSSMTKPVQSLISGQKARDLFAKRNDSIKNTMARDLSGLGSQINDVLANIKKVSSDFESKKKQASQLQGMMGQQHLKFMKIMAARTKSMQTVLESWSKGNFKFLIQHLKTIDIYVASDALTQILAPSRYQISTEFALVIAERSKQMILSKHTTLVKSGISHLLKIVSLFKDEMIKLKTFGIDKGVDLAREQRLRRFDQLIQQYIEVFQSQRIKKVVQKKDQVGLLATQLQKQLKEILNKVYGDTQDLK